MTVRPAFLLTGQPGVGKSTVVQTIAKLTAGHSGGFFTREMRIHGKRTGFEIVTLGGESMVLATMATNATFRRQSRFGHYSINLDAIDAVGIPSILKAVSDGKLVIVDEIGPMEILSQAFRDTVAELMDTPTIAVVGTVVNRPYVFADEIKKHPRVILRPVTHVNRNDLPRQVLAELAK